MPAFGFQKVSQDVQCMDMPEACTARPVGVARHVDVAVQSGLTVAAHLKEHIACHLQSKAPTVPSSQHQRVRMAQCLRPLAACSRPGVSCVRMPQLTSLCRRTQPILNLNNKQGDWKSPDT